MTDNNILQLTKKQHRIVNGMGLVFDGEENDNRITYSHSTLCQTSLPFKTSESREWVCRNGSASVLIEAGQVFDPAKEKFVKLGLPYGTKPRLILLDWNRQAILNQSATIEIEDSLYAFLKRLKLPVEGRVYSMTKKQLAALAAAQITFGRKETDQSATTTYGRIVKEMNLLFPKDKNQRLLWPNTIQFSEEYFESLMSHAVPLNEYALYLLRDSAIELDLYAMFSERLHRIPHNKPQFVPWARLHEQYGSGYKRIRKFREVFKKHLRSVLAVYEDARVEEVTSEKGRAQGLRFYCSKPPVRKLLVQNPVDK